MARYFDNIGFALEGSLVDGVWSDDITERAYKGDILDALRSAEASDKVNDDFRVQNRISIVADAFATENISTIRYAFWNGVRWTVNSVTIERPRLILALGGVWDGQVASS